MRLPRSCSVVDTVSHQAVEVVLTMPLHKIMWVSHHAKVKPHCQQCPGLALKLHCQQSGLWGSPYATSFTPSRSCSKTTLPVTKVLMQAMSYCSARLSECCIAAMIKHHKQPGCSGSPHTAIPSECPGLTAAKTGFCKHGITLPAPMALRWSATPAVPC